MRAGVVVAASIGVIVAVGAGLLWRGALPSDPEPQVPTAEVAAPADEAPVYPPSPAPRNAADAEATRDAWATAGRAEPPPERPIADPVSEGDDWKVRGQTASEAWRGHALDAVDEVIASWPASEQIEVQGIAVELVDRVEETRIAVREGRATHRDLRDVLIMTRGAADRAFDEAVDGDRDKVDALWEALDEASRPY